MSYFSDVERSLVVHSRTEVAAGVVAVLSALGLRMGLAVEVGLFAGLTVLATAVSRRLIQRLHV